MEKSSRDTVTERAGNKRACQWPPWLHFNRAKRICIAMLPYAQHISERISRKLFAWDLAKNNKQGLRGQENELKHFTAGTVLA